MQVTEERKCIRSCQRPETEGSVKDITASRKDRGEIRQKTKCIFNNVNIVRMGKRLNGRLTSKTEIDNYIIKKIS
jgi:hypothetical protein